MRATTVFAVVTIALAAACSPSTAPSSSNSPAASGARASTPEAGANTGTIAGPLQFPGEGIPPLAIYAIATDDSRYFVAETVWYQTHYTIQGLPAGDYYVYATSRLTRSSAASEARTQSPLRFGAGYTQSVPCGLSVSCTDHSMIPVHVTAGATADNVDPADWYVAPDFFPVIPGGGPPTLTLPEGASSYPQPRDAAIYYAELRTGAMVIQASDTCHLNTACASVGEIWPGADAGYFPVMAGSNQDVLNCAVYVFRDQAGGWHNLDFRCRQGGTPFPAINATGHLALGMGETGCINIHAGPVLAARVVACVPSGTQVTIDDGPRYLPPASPTPNEDYTIEYWWHVAGQGWVVHRYVGS